MTRKYPLPGCLLTGDEIAEISRQKIAALTNEEAAEVLAEVESEESDESTEDEGEELIPKTAEDQEAFGVGVYMGTKEASRRFNELVDAGLDFETTMNKVAEEIGNFDAQTEALRGVLTSDPDQELLLDMVEKVAQEDPQALADFAAQRLGELGYEIKVADDDEDEAVAEGVEDEDETEEEAEEAAE